MATIELNEVPLDALRALLAMSPAQRELLKRFIEGSSEVQATVRRLCADLEREQATDQEKRQAISTIFAVLGGRVDCGPIGDTDATSFADRLSQLLECKKITQEELADRMGCTQSAVSKLLSRGARPRRGTILKLAAALQVEPRVLWPQLEVLGILDSVSDFLAEQELTVEQAAALDVASRSPSINVRTRELPSRTRNS